MTKERQSAAYWKRIAQERLRMMWIIANGNGGSIRVGPSAAQDYPGDDVAEVWSHTDRQFGDFIVEARRTRQRS
jgi:hypothetical protein